MTSSQNRDARIARIILRLLLGAVFLYSAWMKLRDPWQLFAFAVDAYGVLPHWAVLFVARTLPWAELALGLLLLWGKLPRLTSAGAALLLLGFFVMMARTYAIGLKIECGCFGSGDPISPRTLARDGALLLAAIGLVLLARTAPKQVSGRSWSRWMLPS